jgi:pimeloyl-ACP methyl ester carboxylesterase
VPSGSGARPVLLFLHGWNSDASTWSGGNDMEAKAYGGGYRAAFLDLHADASMWTNAPLIATAVDAVKAKYGSPVVLVCHSKGGVDAQTAAIWYGVGAKVDRIVTLGSPHRGTPLSDLAWSTWTGWLAALLGSRNEGNRVLQTGYMASFRAQADARPEARATPLYTAGGTRSGPFFSAYYWGGLAIGRTSDGVVPLDSSSLAYQRGRLFTQSWNHNEVHLGGYAWPALAANLGRPAQAFQAAEDETATAAPEPAPEPPALDRLHRGGPIPEGTAEFAFPVDAEQPLVTLLLQTSKPLRQAWAVSPSGRLHAFRVEHPRPRVADRRDPDAEPAWEGAVLHGARLAHLDVPLPEAGTWRVRLAAEGEDAYFFTAHFPADRGRTMPSGAVAQALAPGSETSHRVTLRVPPSGAAVADGFREPAVLNHSLTIVDGPGRERSVVVSEPEPEAVEAPASK